MDTKKIDAVEREMGRLQDRIKELRKAHTETGVRAASLPANQRYWRAERMSEPKHTGAVKRASMDLTRALAELRKP